jgi:hypothetical protein
MELVQKCGWAPLTEKRRKNELKTKFKEKLLGFVDQGPRGPQKKLSDLDV